MKYFVGVIHMMSHKYVLWYFISWFSFFFFFKYQNLLNVIASVLHLGNTQFGEGEEGETFITTETQMPNLAEVRTVLWNDWQQPPSAQNIHVLTADVFCCSCCSPAAGCRWLSSGERSHSQEAHSQRRRGRPNHPLSQNCTFQLFSTVSTLILFVLMFSGSRWSLHWISNRQCRPVML